MLDKTAKKMLSPINTAAVSILGLFNILLGLWIMLPFESIDYIDSSSELVMAIVLTVIGAFITLGSMGDKFKTLLTGVQINFYFWFLSMGGLLYENWQGVLWIFALMISVYSLFVAVNIKVNRQNLPFKKQ